MSDHLQSLKNQINSLCKQIQEQSEKESIGKLLVATGSLYQQLLIFKHVQENNLVTKDELEKMKAQEPPTAEENTSKNQENGTAEPKVEDERQNSVRIKKNLSIGLNDRVAYLKKLFKGDEDEYTNFILSLNATTNQTESNMLIKQEAKARKWDLEDEIFQRLLEAVERAKG